MNHPNLRQLNIKILPQELQILQAYVDKTERTKTDVLREFIRSLQNKTQVPRQPPTSAKI